jgi:hypothetical protein
MDLSMFVCLPVYNMSSHCYNNDLGSHYCNNDHVAFDIPFAALLTSLPMTGVKKTFGILMYSNLV